MARKQEPPDDTFARESFSMRRMTRGQLWAITIVAVAVLIALTVYASV
jgi:hypothetical protein